MNWITNYVRPKLQALVTKTEVPDNLWEKCGACGQMVFHRELTANHRVCTNCAHHMRLPVAERLALLFDEGSFTRIELPDAITDPLKFRDREKYPDRMKRSRAKTGEKEGIQVAHGTIGGQQSVVAVFDFSFMGGSMGIAVGEGLVTAAKLAVAQNAAFVAVPASGGARMQEGILSLMQMPRSVIAVEMVKDAGLPYIVLLTDPTTGGVSASFAMLGDIHISEPGATIGFAGKRVIEETIREQLPEGFQSAEYLLDHGMVDMVVQRKDLNETIGRLLTLLMDRKPSAEVVAFKGSPTAEGSETASKDAAEPVIVEAEIIAPDEKK